MEIITVGGKRYMPVKRTNGEGCTLCTGYDDHMLCSMLPKCQAIDNGLNHPIKFVELTTQVSITELFTILEHLKKSCPIKSKLKLTYDDGVIIITWYYSTWRGHKYQSLELNQADLNNKSALKIKLINAHDAMQRGIKK